MFASVTARIRRWRVQTLKPFGKASPAQLRISVGDRNPEAAAVMAAAFADVDGAEDWQDVVLPAMAPYAFAEKRIVWNGVARNP